MRKFFICTITLLLCLSVSGQSNFSQLKKTVETEALYANHREALRLINSNRAKLSMEQQTELDVLKLECLNALGLHEESFALSQTILVRPRLTPEQEVRIRMQRALVYETGLNQLNCRRELQDAEEIFLKNSDLKTSFFPYFLMRKSSYFRTFGDDKLALKLDMQAEQYAESVTDRKNGAALNMFLGFENYSDPDTALPYFLKAVRLYKSYRHHNGVANMYNKLSNFYLKSGEISTAKQYNDSAVALGSKVESFDTMSEIYRLKSRIEEKQKKYGESLQSYKVAALWTDRENEAQRLTKVQERDLMYHYETNQLRAQKLTLSVRNTRKWNSFLVVGTLLLVFSMLILLYFFKLVSKSKERIRIQNESISDKNAALEKNVQEKEFLVRELNHRVKNNLSVILSLIGFERDECESEQYKRKFEHLHTRVKTISLAHHLFSYNINNFDNSTIEIREYSGKIIEPHKAGCNFPLIVETDIDPFNLPVDQALSYGLLLNELLTNSLKHAVPPEDQILKISLRVKVRNGIAEVEYQDNGRAFGKKAPNKSLGRLIIDAMVEQLGGKCERRHSLYRVQFSVDGKPLG